MFLWRVNIILSICTIQWLLNGKKRCSSSAIAMELHLFSIKPSTCTYLANFCLLSAAWLPLRPDPSCNSITLGRLFPSCRSNFFFNHSSLCIFLEKRYTHIEIWHKNLAVQADKLEWLYIFQNRYRKVSNKRRTLVGNKIVDHSDVVGASPVGAAPTTSSLST